MAANVNNMYLWSWYCYIIQSLVTLVSSKPFYSGNFDVKDATRYRRPIEVRRSKICNIYRNVSAVSISRELKIHKKPDGYWWWKVSHSWQPQVKTALVESRWTDSNGGQGRVAGRKSSTMNCSAKALLLATIVPYEESYHLAATICE